MGAKSSQLESSYTEAPVNIVPVTVVILEYQVLTLRMCIQFDLVTLPNPLFNEPTGTSPAFAMANLLVR